MPRGPEQSLVQNPNDSEYAGSISTQQFSFKPSFLQDQRQKTTSIDFPPSPFNTIAKEPQFYPFQPKKPQPIPFIFVAYMTLKSKDDFKGNIKKEKAYLESVIRGSGTENEKKEAARRLTGGEKTEEEYGEGISPQEKGRKGRHGYESQAAAQAAHERRTLSPEEWSTVTRMLTIAKEDNQHAIAQELDWNVKTVNAYFTGKLPPSPQFMIAFAKKYNNGNIDALIGPNDEDLKRKIEKASDKKRGRKQAGSVVPPVAYEGDQYPDPYEEEKFNWITFIGRVLNPAKPKQEEEKPQKSWWDKINDID